MPRLTPPRLSAAVLFLVLGSAAALAAEPRILGRDDDDFARGLLQEGYRDLAEGVVGAIEKAGPTAEKKVAIDSLRIEMQYYDMPGIQQDARGIARDPQGPAIAWFLDNARNTLAVIEDSSVAD